MDWHSPEKFALGSLYVNVDTDEVLEFLGAAEIEGLSELGASVHALVFRRVADQELRLATELGYRRGERFERFVDEGVDDGG